MDPNRKLRNFELILPRVDLAPMRSELARETQAWFVNTRRQRELPNQRNTQNIGLRSGVGPPETSSDDLQDVADSQHAAAFPATLYFLHDFARARDAALQRVKYVRLAPGSLVYRHRDEGAYYRIRDQYHLVIESSAGSVLVSGEERITMREGELWWFDNKLEHEAYNPGGGWRVHLIFDLLPGPEGVRGGR